MTKPSSKIQVGDDVAEAIDTLMQRLSKKGMWLESLTIDGEEMKINYLEDDPEVVHRQDGVTELIYHS